MKLEMTKKKKSAKGCYSLEDISKQVADCTKKLNARIKEIELKEQARWKKSYYRKRLNSRANLRNT